MDIEKPYFLTNENWYYYDTVEGKYFLTNKADGKAIKSYQSYYLEENDYVISNK